MPKAAVACVPAKVLGFSGSEILANLGPKYVAEGFRFLASIGPTNADGAKNLEAVLVGHGNLVKRSGLKAFDA